ncbi:TPA: HAD family phosphatase [Campylobacter jejuni]|nr:HAD family phosphatase [Campylobacter jejuni]HDZ5084148.1 HAD family phosphatase [Campylobacter jejuni]HDZ5087520.1 HAD family phosphatase [Campylobacter jejuni]HDZ5090910.1 HAD family phosphatase [Campylobacter jejuni]HDZ5092482.1 HAD family phosphatase [Campylobacter jejuni]
MKLVLFDLDDTLIQGDSAKLWLEFCIQKGFLPKEYLEKIIFYQKQYHEKKLNMDEFMTFFLQSVKDKNEDEISFLIDEFIKIYIKPYKKAKELIAKYQDQRCIIISATAEFLVKKIASFLGVKESIAIKCECVDGKFSGKAYGIYSFKEGKVLRLKEYLGKDYEKWMKDSYFFSDSINDLPLLESVSQAFVCNGDERILKIAKERKYEILNF